MTTNGPTRLDGPVTVDEQAVTAATTSPPPLVNHSDVHIAKERDG
ncbi:hypothetical protein [Paenarthrobacter ureafaciens]|nr:hypothetical protein [Paenarthrobacter ureafaciens]MCY0975546.1 hypothetical protein [Paenarthrobacter ureafaciens]